MLQIITGKFFTTSNLYITRHRAVLYTNYATSERLVETATGATVSPATFDTVAGSFSSTTLLQPSGEVFPWLYEVDEKLEAVRPDGTKEFLIAVGADYFIQDFAAVAAFALNITCTPDFDLTRRLIHVQQAALGVPHPPKQYVDRVFDKRIEPQKGDDTRLQEFVRDLVGLERRTYRAVIRAIRRYVNGLHRIADDLDLAYALLVASIESLAQGFDAFTPEWEDFEQRKREALDKVLSKASVDVSDDVRKVLLTHEHLALAKRYREFALAHIRPSFFREEANGETLPVRRSDLPGVLERAYVFRSKYVHTLLELPRLLTVSPSTGDTSLVEGAPALTFHGLARIARHVISEFVARSPKCARETLDYRRELPNRIQVELAFSVWGTWSSKFDHKSARRYLSGFLAELTTFLTTEPPARINLTDVRPLIERVEKFVPGLSKPEQRLPLLTLYLLFHRLAPSVDYRPNAEQFFNKYARDFDTPSIESMLIHVLDNNVPGWTLDEFEAMRRAYFKQRYTKKGLVLGKTLEAAITLFSAEMHRSQGQVDRARTLVSEAVENLPGQKSLLEFERRMDEEPLPAINWRELLLPAPREMSPGDSQEHETSLVQAAKKPHTQERIVNSMLWCGAGVLLWAAIRRWRRS
jgi:hypothetical protein